VTLILVKQCPVPDQTISHGRSLSLQLIFTQGDSVQYLCDVGYVIRTPSNLPKGKAKLISIMIILSVHIIHIEIYCKQLTS
jgi:hypothetical protein